eukprot:scaffold2505_cov152-Ochromonas_danica.AAC.7
MKWYRQTVAAAEDLLDGPRLVSNAIESELFHALARVRRSQAEVVGVGVEEGDLVGEEEDRSRGALDGLVVQQLVQLLLRHANPNAICAVDDEDDGLRVLVVVLPERAIASLAAHVVDGEVNVVLRELFHLEAHCGSDFIGGRLSPEGVSQSVSQSVSQ